MKCEYVKNSEEGDYVCHSPEAVMGNHEELVKIVVLRFELDIFRIHLLEAYHCISLSSYSSPQEMVMTKIKMWFRINALDLDSRGSCSESRPGHQLSSLKFLLVFLSPLTHI